MNTWVKQKNQIGNRTELQLHRIFFSLGLIVAEYRIDYLHLFTLHSFINYILGPAYSVLCICVLCETVKNTSQAGMKRLKRKNGERVRTPKTTLNDP